MQIKTIMLMAIISLTSTGCADDGERYLGKWAGLKRDYSAIAKDFNGALIMPLEIIRNGDKSFTVIKRNRAIPAVLNEAGILEIHGGMKNYSFIEESGNLTDGYTIYVRE
jgi:hypothetical protein